MTAPGWYPDPSDPSRQRFFDGNMWTENYAPFGAPPTQPVENPAKPGMSLGKKIGLGVAVVGGLAILGTLGDSDNPSTSSYTADTTRAVEAAPTTPDSGFTRAQDNAIEKAESYLRNGAFSRQGLIEQLEYNKYSQADATFAVDHIEATGGVDWNDEAVEKADSYLRNGSFSLESLIEQLEYNKFTPAQAQFGATTAYGR